MITLAKMLCDVKSVAELDFSKVIARSDRSRIGQSYLREKGTFGSTLIEKLRSSDENFFSFSFVDSDYIVYPMPVANNDCACPCLIQRPRLLH